MYKVHKLVITTQSFKHFFTRLCLSYNLHDQFKRFTWTEQFRREAERTVRTLQIPILTSPVVECDSMFEIELVNLLRLTSIHTFNLTLQCVDVLQLLLIFFGQGLKRSLDVAEVSCNNFDAVEDFSGKSVQ